jgi:hypothetical protein
MCNGDFPPSAPRAAHGARRADPAVENQADEPASSSASSVASPRTSGSAGRPLRLLGWAGGWCARRSAVTLPPTITQNEDAVTQLVYRNTAQSSPPACGSVCSELWLSEHGLMPNQVTSEALHSELEMLTRRTGLMPRLSVIGGRVLPALGAFELGWVVGTGINRKFLHLRGEGLSEPPPVGYAARPRIDWITAGLRPYAGATPAPVDGWYISLPNANGSATSQIQVAGRQTSCFARTQDLPEGFTLVGPASDFTWCSALDNGQRIYFPSSVGLNPAGDMSYGFAGEDDYWHATGPVEDYTSQPADVTTTTVPTDPGVSTITTRTKTELESGRYPTLLPWLDNKLGGSSGDPTQTVTVPDCTGVTYATCVSRLQGAGLDNVEQYTLPETNLDAGNGEVVETDPEAGENVDPATTTVTVAANPPTAVKTEVDQRCESGEGPQPDPGPPLPDGTALPQYQTRETFDSIDASGDFPPYPSMVIPLRYGTRRFGWRKIKMTHGYGTLDAEQTRLALETDQTPTPAKWGSNNQRAFHYIYSASDGAGGTMQCVRSVIVEYAPDKNGYFRGVQNSYQGALVQP